MNLNIYVFGTISDKNPSTTAKCIVQYIVQYTTRKGMFFTNILILDYFHLSRTKFLGFWIQLKKKFQRKNLCMEGFQQERAGNHSQTHLAFGRMNKLVRREVNNPNKFRVLFI